MCNRHNFKGIEALEDREFLFRWPERFGYEEETPDCSSFFKPVGSSDRSTDIGSRVLVGRFDRISSGSETHAL